MIEGGVSKTRWATKLSSTTIYSPGRVNALSNPNRVFSDSEQVNGGYSFADSNVDSDAAEAPVAVQLVNNNQKPINSFGYVVPTYTIPPTVNFNFSIVS